jgi:hypothetical protein
MTGLPGGDDIGEILKLVANVLLLVTWLWRHRPRG